MFDCLSFLLLFNKGQSACQYYTAGAQLFITRVDSPVDYSFFNWTLLENESVVRLLIRLEVLLILVKFRFLAIGKH
jgi:hypothetical protein